MRTLQIRGVRDDVHERLKSQAATAGQSLNEFLLERMSDVARIPTIPKLAARVHARAPYAGPSSADVIRGDPERR